MTEKPLPLACSLSSAEMSERGDWLGRLRGEAVSVVADAGGVTARFPRRSGLDAELRRLAAAEAECCPFLTISVDSDPDGLALRVEGPPDARPIIDAMFALS